MDPQTNEIRLRFALRYGKREANGLLTVQIHIAGRDRRIEYKAYRHLSILFSYQTHLRSKCGNVVAG